MKKNLLKIVSFLFLTTVLSACQSNEKSNSISSEASSSTSDKKQSVSTSDTQNVPLEIFDYREEELVHSDYKSFEDAESDLEVTDGTTTQAYTDRSNISGGRIVKKGTDHEMIYLGKLKDSEKWEAYFIKKQLKSSEVT